MPYLALKGVVDAVLQDPAAATNDKEMAVLLSKATYRSSTLSPWRTMVAGRDRERTWDQISFLASIQQTSPPCEPLANQITSFVCEFDNQEHTFRDPCPKNDPASWLARRNLVYASVPDATTGNAWDRVRIDEIRDNCFYTLNRAAGIDAEALILASLFPRLALLYVHLSPPGDQEAIPFEQLLSQKLEADALSGTDSWPRLTTLSLTIHDCPQPAAVLIPASVQVVELRAFDRPSSATGPAIRVHTTTTHPVSQLQSLKILASSSINGSRSLSAVAALLRTGSVPNIHSIHVEEHTVDPTAAQDLLNACRSNAQQIKSIKLDLSYLNEDEYNTSTGQTQVLPATCLGGLPELDSLALNQGYIWCPHEERPLARLQRYLAHADSGLQRVRIDGLFPLDTERILREESETLSRLNAVERLELCLDRDLDVAEPRDLRPYAREFRATVDRLLEKGNATKAPQLSVFLRAMGGVKRSIVRYIQGGGYAMGEEEEEEKEEEDDGEEEEDDGEDKETSEAESEADFVGEEDEDETMGGIEASTE